MEKKNCFIATFFMSSSKRANYIKKKHLFSLFGNNCYYHPYKIPVESKLIKIHDNVIIASEVSFITHDVIDFMLNNLNEGHFDRYEGEIEIFDNVFIGAGSKILYNIKIGPNAIVAAGSIVTKDAAKHNCWRKSCKSYWKF